MSRTTQGRPEEPYADMIHPPGKPPKHTIMYQRALREWKRARRAAKRGLTYKPRPACRSRTSRPTPARRRGSRRSGSSPDDDRDGEPDLPQHGPGLADSLGQRPESASSLGTPTSFGTDCPPGGVGTSSGGRA